MNRLSRKEATELLRITPGYLSRLEKAGHLRAGADGKFDAGDLVQQWTDHKVASASSPKTELQQRVLQLKAETLELEAMKARQELWPTQKVKDLIKLIDGIYRIDAKLFGAFLADRPQRKRG